MTKFQKELLGFSIGVFLIFLVGILIYKYKSYKDAQYWNNIEKEQTIATVTDYTSGPKASGSAVATYVVNDKQYSVNIEEGYVYGEKFQLEYNKDNPSENRIYREFPIFLEDESTNYVVGKLTSYDSWFFKYFNYRFWIDNKFYEGGHYQDNDSSSKYPNVEEGQLFVVEYWLANPKRSIMHLDKPVEYINNWWKYKVDKNGKIIK